MSIPRDVQEFLDNYPGQKDDSGSTHNVEFYQNKRRCQPDRLLINEIHEQWAGDYAKLESKHGFIQWLFPIQEYGMNYESQPLQKHEVESMKVDPLVIERIVASYRLMLDFYGMKLVSVETGLLARADPPRDFTARYKNLVRSGHNNLRISRILKSLSEFGLERLNAGFLLHVLNEQSEHQELLSNMLVSSMDRWWANCLRNEEERNWIGKTIKQVRSGKAGGGFTFTRAMYEDALQRRADNGRLDESS